MLHEGDLQSPERKNIVTYWLQAHHVFSGSGRNPTAKSSLDKRCGKNAWVFALRPSGIQFNAYGELRHRVPSREADWRRGRASRMRWTAAVGRPRPSPALCLL